MTRRSLDEHLQNTFLDELTRYGRTLSIAATIALASIAGCKDDGPTGGGNGGGPTNSPLSVNETYEQEIDANTQGTWSLKATDDDGLKHVAFELTYDPQTGQDSVLASIDEAVSNKTTTEQVSAALGPGSVTGTYTITSNNPAGSDDNKSGSFTTQIRAPENNETYNVTGNVINANNNDAVTDANTALLQGQNTQDSDQTDNQGAFGMQVTHPEETSEDYDLQITKQGYKDYIQTIAVSNDRELTDLMLAPQDVLFTGELNEETLENTSAYVTAEELASIIDYQEAGRDTSYVETSDANLEILIDGTDFELKPADGYSGAANYTIVAISNTAGRAEQQETLTIQNAPKADLTIINNVTDNPVPAYLLIEDETGAVIDSLTSTNGQFSGVALPGADSAWVRAAELRNGEAHGFEHRKQLGHHGNDISKTIATINRDRRDIGKNKTGEYTWQEMTEKLRWIAKKLHGQADYSPLNNNEGQGGTFEGVLHRAHQSANGVSYDKIIIPDSVWYVQQEFSSKMDADYSALIQEQYDKEINPLFGEFSISLDFVDQYNYDTNDRPRNHGFILPREDFTDRFGSVSVKGESPELNLLSEVFLFTDPETGGLSTEGKTRTFLQETTNGFVYLNALAPDFFDESRFDRTETIIHDNTNRLTLSDYDRSIGWIVYEPTFKPGEKMDNIMYLPASQR